MKTLITFLLLAVSIAVSQAQDLTAGIVFQDGQRITAAQLGQLVTGATIQPNFYNNKVSQPSVLPTDTLLVYSAASGTFHRVLATGIFTNAYIVSSQPIYASALNTNDPYTFLGYDTTNNSLFQISSSNLVSSLSPWIAVSSLNFSNTLSNYSPTQPNPMIANVPVLVTLPSPVPPVMVMSGPPIAEPAAVLPCKSSIGQ